MNEEARRITQRHRRLAANEISEHRADRTMAQLAELREEDWAERWRDDPAGVCWQELKDRMAAGSLVTPGRWDGIDARTPAVETFAQADTYPGHTSEPPPTLAPAAGTVAALASPHLKLQSELEVHKSSYGDDTISDEAADGQPLPAETAPVATGIREPTIRVGRTGGSYKASNLADNGGVGLRAVVEHGRDRFWEGFENIWLNSSTSLPGVLSVAPTLPSPPVLDVDKINRGIGVIRSSDHAGELAAIISAGDIEHYPGSLREDAPDIREWVPTRFLASGSAVIVDVASAFEGFYSGLSISLARDHLAEFTSGLVTLTFESRLHFFWRRPSAAVALSGIGT